MESLTLRLDEFTEARWHVGASPYFSDECTIMNSQLSDSEATEHLRSLYLRDVPVLEGIQFPELLQLSLVYHETRRPVVKGIVAPKLLRFVVHYTHEVPEFSDMGTIACDEQCDEDMESARQDVFHNCYHGDDEFEKLNDIRTFELANINSISKGAGLCQPKPEKENFPNDFSFVGRFAIVHLFGVPNTFFESADLTHVNKLRWDLTAPPLETTILLPFVINVSIVINCDGITIPALKMEGQITRLDGRYNVMILGSSVNISRLWDPYKGKRLKDLCIYNSPLVVKKKPGSVLEVSTEDWDRILGLAYLSLGTLELIGFKMPFLSQHNCLGEKVQRIWEDHDAEKITLRPVIDVGTQSSELNLDAISFCYPQILDPRDYERPDSTHFVISPFVIDSTSPLGMTDTKITITYPNKIGTLGYNNLAPLTIIYAKFRISVGELTKSFRFIDVYKKLLVMDEVINLNDCTSVMLHPPFRAHTIGKLIGSVCRASGYKRDWLFDAVLSDGIYV